MADAEANQVEVERGLESVILAKLIECHPRPLSEDELTRQMTEIVDTPDRVEAVGRALDALIAVALIRRVNGALVPTAASLRVGELELGL
jgi:hypothetical protein